MDEQLLDIFAWAVAIAVGAVLWRRVVEPWLERDTFNAEGRDQ